MSSGHWKRATERHKRLTEKIAANRIPGNPVRASPSGAILRDPAALILDESTSALDSENEALVLQALDRLMEGRTSLVIAHRLSTIRRADRIVVLKEGQTVEEGTHEELVGREDGVYRLLTEMQLEPA